MTVLKGYVGTYASAENPGTYSFCLDTETGMLSDPVLLYRQTNTKYSAWHRGLLATVTENDRGCGTALLDVSGREAKLLDTHICEKTTACFMTWHEGLLYTAGYHDGHVLIYSPEGGRLKLVRQLFIAEESGCHQVMFHGRWMLVPCLKLDKVCIFDTENGFAPAGTLEFAPGTGPRHGVFTADHKRFFFVSETSNQLFTYRVSGLDFQLEGVVPVLPAGHTGKADTAAIRLSEDEKTLYVSVRGAHLVSVFRLGQGLPQPISHTDSHGLAPWDILLVPGAPLILISNRKSSTLVCCALEADGTIGPVRGQLEIPQCVGLSMEI